MDDDEIDYLLEKDKKKRKKKKRDRRPKAIRSLKASSLPPVGERVCVWRRRAVWHVVRLCGAAPLRNFSLIHVGGGGSAFLALPPSTHFNFPDPEKTLFNRSAWRFRTAFPTRLCVPLTWPRRSTTRPRSETCDRVTWMK